MYAETGHLMFPYFQNFSSDVQQFDDFCHSHKFVMDNLIQTSTVSDYDLGGEGDLFKAPEPIIEQPISIISSGENTQDLKPTDIESLQNQEFLNDVFYECKNLLQAKESSEVVNLSSFPDENQLNVHHLSCQIPKSMSSDSLNTMDWARVKSSFLNFSEIDFGNDAAYGMRRAFSEGDIKTLSDANRSLGGYYQPPLVLMSEDRMQKLSRYRNKKTKRNFGRKIKYACRKALADSQPRIRGRFAKTTTEESEIMIRK